MNNSASLKRGESPSRASLLPVWRAGVHDDAESAGAFTAEIRHRQARILSARIRERKQLLAPDGERISQDAREILDLSTDPRITALAYDIIKLTDYNNPKVPWPGYQKPRRRSNGR